MKRILRWAGIAVLAILLAVGGFALYVHVSGIPRYDVAIPDLVVERTPERVARGRHLAISLCAECHRDAQTRTLSGTRMLDLPPEFGVAYSRNITNHPEKGIGSWKDGEIAWLLRTGIHPKTGLYVPPWMPKFAHMSDEDVLSIIAWLRSDDPLLAATPTENRASEPTWFAKFLCHVAFKPFDYPKAPIAHPDTTNAVVYGRYLATGVYDCYACHSADIATIDMVHPENSPGFFGGGTVMMNVDAKPVVTSNITFHPTNGIGKWSEADFITAMHDGYTPNGKLLRYPMVRGVHMDTAELRAMYAYLRTVPQLDVAHTDAYTYSEDGLTKGNKAYNTYGCVGCHGSTGLGYGDLRSAGAKYPDDSTLTDVIQHITNYYPESTMPVFNGKINKDDLLPLVAHVRSLGKGARP